ncbi:GIY-YIG nuclease family protein [Vibrio sp. WXL103]|uniref:GIY-YIG nuclease family protein n=1 Tax=unclassified Vibrio TaxID=2614977 RepID=UPI003EC70011
MKDFLVLSCWFIYLIRTKDNALYCGVTTDVTRRFEQHRTGKGAKALRGKGPLILVWSSPAGKSRSEAQQWEHKLKKLPKSRKESLIKGEWCLEQM